MFLADRDERGPNPWGGQDSRGGGNAFGGERRGHRDGWGSGGGRDKSEAEWQRLEVELFGDAKAAGIAFEKYGDIRKLLHELYHHVKNKYVKTQEEKSEITKT